ncbi:hypothetical protein CR513_44664, partial [Mucuna pruriens]
MALSTQGFPMSPMKTPVATPSQAGLALAILWDWPSRSRLHIADCVNEKGPIPGPVCIESEERVVGQWHRAFEGRRDNLLSLLEVKVQPTALSVLAQYYDVPLQCFTFKDFQLAPTLEEYKCLLGLPLAKVLESKIARKKRNWNGLEGISRIYLEERLHQLQKEENWSAIMNVYELLVYGIVLFSHLEDYTDLEAIEVFLAKRDRGENPTIAVLANTYYTLNYCCERKGKSLRCCTHLLYLWMTDHLFHNKRKTKCPIEDFKWSWIKTMSKAD